MSNILSRMALTYGPFGIRFRAFQERSGVDVLHDAIRGWTKKPVDSWNSVEPLANRADLAAAYQMALRLEKRAPGDYTAAYHKGDIMVQMGKLDLALQEYQKAYQAYPNPTVEERVATVTKALEMKAQPKSLDHYVSNRASHGPKRRSS